MQPAEVVVVEPVEVEEVKDEELAAELDEQEAFLAALPEDMRNEILASQR